MENETPETSDSTPETTDGDRLLDAMGVKVPEQVAREFYRCRKGHVVEGLYAFVARTSEDDPDVLEDSGPICRVCQARWMRRMFCAKLVK
jgi:hypothetical protein